MDSTSLYKFTVLEPFELKVIAIVLAILVIFAIFTKAFTKRNHYHKALYIKTRTKIWIFITTCIVIVLPKGFAVSAMALISYIAFRELISALPIRDVDRKTILWCYLSIPVQAYLIYIEWFGCFIIFIPVIMFIFLPVRSIYEGNYKNITNSLSLIQWSLMLTVFSLGHLSYILILPPHITHHISNAGIVLFLVILTQTNDILIFFFDRYIGKHKIIPNIDISKTYEGRLAAIICCILLGIVLRPLTPFTFYQTVIMSAIIAFAGYWGHVLYSAIKRDVGKRQLGNFITGQGGLVDRLDSLSFTSVIMLHILLYWIY